MIITDAQVLTLTEAAKPLVKWLNENCHPHMVVHVCGSGAELLEGNANVKIEEFIKD